VDPTVEKVVREVARRGHGSGGDGQGGDDVNPTAEEEEWRRRLWSVVATRKHGSDGR
jgi:hypothetical protein